MSYIAKNGRLYTSGASEALTLLDDKFSVNKSYSKGDSCIYNDYLWKFTSDKPAGEWDSSVVEQCRIMDIVDDVNGRLTQTTDSIQNQIVPTASIESGATASRTYNVGDFLVKDGILYKATADIAKDDALTVGTNIAMTTVGGELSSINERLLRYKTISFRYDYTEKGKVVKLKLKDIVKDLGTYAFVDGSTYLEMTDDLGYYINLPIGCTTKSGGGYASCYIEFTPDFINSMNICFYSGSLEGMFCVILHYLPIE